MAVKNRQCINSIFLLQIQRCTAQRDCTVFKKLKRGFHNILNYLLVAKWNVFTPHILYVNNYPERKQLSTKMFGPLITAIENKNILFTVIENKEIDHKTGIPKSTTFFI